MRGSINKLGENGCNVPYPKVPTPEITFGNLSLMVQIYDTCIAFDNPGGDGWFVTRRGVTELLGRLSANMDPETVPPGWSENECKLRLWNSTRRCLKKDSLGNFSQKNLLIGMVAKKTGQTACADVMLGGCRGPVHIDRRLAGKDGWMYDGWNLRLVCRTHNCAKGAKSDKDHVLHQVEKNLAAQGKLFL